MTAGALLSVTARACGVLWEYTGRAEITSMRISAPVVPFFFHPSEDTRKEPYLIVD